MPDSRARPPPSMARYCTRHSGRSTYSSINHKKQPPVVRATGGQVRKNTTDILYPFDPALSTPNISGGGYRAVSRRPAGPRPYPRECHDCGVRAADGAVFEFKRTPKGLPTRCTDCAADPASAGLRRARRCTPRRTCPAATGDAVRGAALPGAEAGLHHAALCRPAVVA